MKVSIIDYGSGNLHSTAKAFEKMAAVTGHAVEVTDDAKALNSASHIVLPGVGAFGDCFAGLNKISGIMAVLDEEVRQKKKPFLGICVGMQLLADKGFEHGEHKGMGWISGEVKAIKPADSTLKIPHMGWNELVIRNPHPVFSGIKDGDHAYFVHSYNMLCECEEDILAETEYGGMITAAIARENIIGLQFHPEKSQATGLKIIENFLQMESV